MVPPVGRVPRDRGATSTSARGSKSRARDFQGALIRKPLDHERDNLESAGSDDQRVRPRAGRVRVTTSSSRRSLRPVRRRRPHRDPPELARLPPKTSKEAEHGQPPPNPDGRTADGLAHGLALPPEAGRRRGRERPPPEGRPAADRPPRRPPRARSRAGRRSTRRSSSEFVEQIGASDPKRLAAFHETGELDTSYQVAGLPRFRVNAFRQRGEISLRVPRDPERRARLRAARASGRRPAARRPAPRPRPRHRRHRRRARRRRSPR